MSCFLGASKFPPLYGDNIKKELKTKGGYYLQGLDKSRTATPYTGAENYNILILANGVIRDKITLFPLLYVKWPGELNIPGGPGRTDLEDLTGSARARAPDLRRRARLRAGFSRQVQAVRNRLGLEL